MGTSICTSQRKTLRKPLPYNCVYIQHCVDYVYNMILLIVPDKKRRHFPCMVHIFFLAIVLIIATPLLNE